MVNLLAYEEVAEFLAALSPHKIIKLRPSAEVQSKVEELIAKKKDDQITIEEKDELERYMASEYLIALTKARARLRLSA